MGAAGPHSHSPAGGRGLARPEQGWNTGAPARLSRGAPGTRGALLRLRPSAHALETDGDRWPGGGRSRLSSASISWGPAHDTQGAGPVLGLLASRCFSFQGRRGGSQSPGAWAALWRHPPVTRHPSVTRHPCVTHLSGHVRGALATLHPGFSSGPCRQWCRLNASQPLPECGGPRPHPCVYAAVPVWVFLKTKCHRHSGGTKRAVPMPSPLAFLSHPQLQPENRHRHFLF